MDVVKCSTWEDAFWDRIQAVRGLELGVLWKSFVVAALNVFLLNAIPTLVSVCTFGVYVLLGNELTATTAVRFVYVRVYIASLVADEWVKMFGNNG